MMICEVVVQEGMLYVYAACICMYTQQKILDSFNDAIIYVGRIVCFWLHNHEKSQIKSTLILDQIDWKMPFVQQFLKLKNENFQFVHHYLKSLWFASMS